ncbi:MAG TPA: hypothetical protein VER33_06030 [Polyangiaceae bacterium]|nr:hypothetical protein [Polyangiaceae bacterium]
MFRRIIGFTGVLTLSLLAAACGGSGQGAESPTTPSVGDDVQTDTGSGTVGGTGTDADGTTDGSGVSPGTGSPTGAENGAGAPAGGEGVGGD